MKYILKIKNMETYSSVIEEGLLNATNKALSFLAENKNAVIILEKCGEKICELDSDILESLKPY